MRTPQELQDKLDDARTKSDARDSSAIYWFNVREILEHALGDPPQTAVQIRRMLQQCVVRLAKPGIRMSTVMDYGQRAGIYRWMLEPPKPVISDEGRRRAKRRANKTKSHCYVYADATGTHVFKENPHRRDCELVEPDGQPVKPPNKRIRHDLRPAMIRRAQAERRLG